MEFLINAGKLDLTATESRATYEEIKAYMLEKFGLNVSNLYISQIKRKCGLEVGDSYDQPKFENVRVSPCPPEKEKTVMAMPKHFQIVFVIKIEKSVRLTPIF